MPPWFLADLIEPVGDSGIPIPEQRLPRRQQEQRPQPLPGKPGSEPAKDPEISVDKDDGHIDDYA